MRIAAALLLVAAACDRPSVWPAACDATILDACVAYRGQSYQTEYIERQMRLALAYWNAPPDTLAGWAIVYRPRPFACLGVDVQGCTWFADAVVELYTPTERCPENSALVHELGHVLHGDPQHLGPWWNANAEQAATMHIMHDPGASPGCYY